MTNKATRRPTDAELEILQVLWRRGKSTVREVMEELSEGRSPGYTTVLKILQIMTGKGLVARESRGQSHVYWTSSPEEETQRSLVRDLVQRAFGGSTEKLVLQALSETKASDAELAEVMRLLKESRKDRR